MDFRSKLLATISASLRPFLLISLFTIPIAQSVDLSVLKDPDIWWHLRTGQWIVENRAVPESDAFSSYGAGRSWTAYSWLFEVLIFELYRALGLSGIILYIVVLWLLIAAALYILLQYLAGSHTPAVVLTAIAMLVMGTLSTPRPWLFSILFFIVELNILWRAREIGNQRRLFILPFLFALWANLHIQFIYGLFVFAIAAFEPLIEQVFTRSTNKSEKMRATVRLWITWAVCVLATLANPYHLGIYRVIYEYSSHSAPLRYVSELQSPDFHRLGNLLLLGATLGATFAIARRLKVRPFTLLLLLSGAFVSFRSQRDIWFMSVVAVSIIADAFPSIRSEERTSLSKRQALGAMAAVLILSLITWQVKHVREETLERVVVAYFPVAASQFVEERGYEGPLYNNFNWGGYLIWRLPQLPVAVDGRTNLYGDERLARSFETWGGGVNWESDPELSSARLVIAPRNMPLASILRLDQRFKLVYEDAVAVVFISRQQR